MSPSDKFFIKNICLVPDSDLNEVILYAQNVADAFHRNCRCKNPIFWSNYYHYEKEFIAAVSLQEAAVFELGCRVPFYLN